MKPRAIVLFVALLLAAGPARSTTVTGTMKDIQGNLLSGTGDYATLQLMNFGSNVPRVLGTNIVVQTQPLRVTPAQLQAGVTIQGNYTITPAGTFYRVAFFQGGKSFRSADHLICVVTAGGCSADVGSYNLDLATPLTTTPVVAPPTGDSTYLRLDAGNTANTDTYPFTFGKLAVLGTGSEADFESASVARPFRRLAYASFPGTCTANREFLERSDPAMPGQVVYVCNSGGNGWDLVGGGGLEAYPQWWGAVGQKQTHHVLSTAANTTITISDKYDPFVASDAGKTIRVILRNAATLEDFETTISSVTSATQAVVAQAPTITSTTGEAYWFPSTEDATAAIQAAVNSGAGTVRFIKGVYVTTAPITNVRATVKLLGDGTRNSIILMRKSSTGDSFTLTDMMHPTLEGLTVVGPGMDATAGGAVRINHSDFDNVEGLKINDVLVSHVADSGFVITTPILSTIMNSKVLFGAGHGFHIQGGTTTDLINDYASTVVGAGVLIENGAAIMGVQGGATESAGIGILIRDSYSVSVDHYDTEAQIDRSFAAPAAAPLLSATAGGTVTPGTYYWKFCWMHGVAPSPESAESLQLTVVAGANQTITANLGTVPAGVHVARIYSTLVNGASGSEGFLKDITGLTPGTTGYATKTTAFTSVGAVPPTFWYDGHGYVVSNSKKVSISNSHSRDLPLTDSRHYLVTDNSSEVSIARPRVVQGGVTPTYDVELTAGSADNELVTSLASARILNSGTNTLRRNGGLSSSWGSTLWSPYYSGGLPAPPALLKQFVNSYPVKVVRISAFATAGAGGTLGSQFQMTDGTNNCNTAQAMLPVATVFSSDVPTGTCAFAAGSTLSLRTIADDHTTRPGSTVFTVEMVGL